MAIWPNAATTISASSSAAPAPCAPTAAMAPAAAVCDRRRGAAASQSDVAAAVPAGPGRSWCCRWRAGWCCRFAADWTDRPIALRGDRRRSYLPRAVECRHCDQRRVCRPCRTPPCPPSPCPGPGHHQSPSPAGAVAGAAVGLAAGLAGAPTHSRSAGQAGAHRRAVCPGGTTDITARVVAEQLTTALRQSVLVENKAGAGGSIEQQVAKAAPGGYDSDGNARHPGDQPVPVPEDAVQHDYRS